MAGTAVAPKFATWSAPGASFRIEYSNAILGQIREVAVEGFHRVPHGGVETGGVFFGTPLKNGIRIKAWRPVTCEYAKGPSFVLSEKDEAALAEMLRASRADPELAGLEPAGWYRSHTRSEINLSESDQSFYARFFPKPWQVALIVRPASFAPTRGGFFFREADGTIRAERSYRVFDLPHAEATPEASPLPRPKPASAPAPPAMALDPPPVVEAPVLSRDHEGAVVKSKPTRNLAGRPIWYIVALAAMALVLLSIWLFQPSHNTLSLSASDAAGQLQISWDRGARPIRRAAAAKLEINDHGLRTNVDLTATDLRSGSVSYSRQSGDVVVHLIVAVPGSPPIEEMTRFVKPAEPAAPAPSTPASPTSQARVIIPAAAPPIRHIVPFRAPEPVARPPAGPSVPDIAPPQINTAPAAAQSSPLSSVLGSAPAPSAPAPTRPNVTAAAPASGRIIWTGKLPKSGLLEIENDHASAGAVNAALPPAAARISAYPGELTASGITLYTSDAKYSQPLTEAAGARNGWNSTTYTLDAKRAATVKVLEQPGPNNGYKLVLRCDNAKLGVLVIDWRTASN